MDKAFLQKFVSRCRALRGGLFLPDRPKILFVVTTGDIESMDVRATILSAPYAPPPAAKEGG